MEGMARLSLPPWQSISGAGDGCASTGSQPWEDVAKRGFFPAPEADMTDQAGILLPLGLALAPVQLRPADCGWPSQL